MQSRTMRGGLLAVLAAGALLAGMTGAGAQTVLTMWTRGAGTEELAKRFNESQADIQVEVTRVPGAQYVTKLGAAVTSGDAPDVMDIDDIQGPLFASNGIILDLTDRIGELPYKDSLNAAQMELGEYEGRYYGVPNIAGPSVMMYNKDLFRQAGLDPDKPPANWAEVEDAARKITALGDGIYGFDIPGGCAGCIAYVFYPIIWASGGQVMTDFGPDQRTTYAESAPVAEAFSFIQKMWQEGLVNPAAQTQDGSTWGEDFAAGKLGILFGTPESYPAAVAAGVDVGVAPIPGKDGGTSTFVGGDILVISAQSEHPEEAWTFVQWMLEPAQQEYIAELALVPTRLDMLTPEFAEKYPAAAAGLEAMKTGQVPKSLAWNAIAGSDSSPLVVAYQRIVFGGENPADVLTQADTDSRDLITQQSSGL